MDVPNDFIGAVDDWDQLRKDIAFVRALRNLQIVTTTGPLQIQYKDGSENAALDLRSLSGSGAVANDELPAQSDSSGYHLETDGTSVAWRGPAFTQITRAAAQSISNTTDTAVSFDTGTTNSDGLWTSGTRLTIPTNYGGVWLFSGQVVYAANATGVRYIYLQKNGSAFGATTIMPGITGASVYMNITRPIRLVAGDYMELYVWQSSGGALNLTSADIFATRLSG